MKSRYLLLALVAIIVPLLFSSNVSWLYLSGDQDLFFMAGKGWINGLLPYRDFSDSKGPLLWGIYALGYLIHRTSMIGMFVVECIFDFATLWIFYKLCQLFDLPKKWDYFIIPFAGLMLYYYGYHGGTVSETFSMPFMICAWYWTVRIVYLEEKGEKKLFVGAFLCGMCTMATILIKYNSTAIVGIMMICVFATLISRHLQLNWIKLISCYMGGLLLLAFPFATWFIATGTMSDFLFDYFVEVPQTIQNMHTDSMFGGALRFLHNNITLLAFLAVIVITAFAMLWKEKGIMKRVTMLVCVTFSLLIIMRNGIFQHYYEPLYPFLALPTVFLVRALEKHKLGFASAFMGAGLLLLANYALFYDRGRTPFKSTIDLAVWQKTCDDIAKLMSQVSHPTMMYIGDFGGGYCIKPDAIPGCKFWSPQAGITKRMTAMRKEAVKKRQPQFLIASTEDELVKIAKKVGYQQIYKGSDGEGRTIRLYKRDHR